MPAPKPDLTFEKVRSSNIQELAYCPTTQTLGVRFASGGLFHYKGVPQDAYAQLRNAKSIGTHFARNIRPTYSAIAVPK